MYIAVVSLYVDDVDRAIEFYTGKLGWQKTMDAPMGEGNRWVTVAPNENQTAFTLSQRKGEPGERPAGFSGVVMEVDDVKAEHGKLQGLGVEFVEQPRIEPWGGWATFKDTEGNVHGMHSPPPN
jgi:predicted enzyme related to lactoylglutathione lyase